MAPRGEEGFLRNYHVVPDKDVILIVEPHAFTDPRTVANM